MCRSGAREALHFLPFSSIHETPPPPMLSNKFFLLSPYETATYWTTNLSILKEAIPEYSLEGLLLKLKLQYFGHLMGRADSLEKTLMLGKIEGRRKRGRQRMR